MGGDGRGGEGRRRDREGKGEERGGQGRRGVDRLSRMFSIPTLACLDSILCRQCKNIGGLLFRIYLYNSQFKLFEKGQKP